IAPTSGSAHGTTEPTARNFDCTATPHCFASRSQAAIENVATSGARSAIGQFGEIELEQVASLLGHGHDGYLWSRECLPHRFGRRRVHHHWTAGLERLGDRTEVADALENECLLG